MTDTTDQQAVTVAQEDREAAAALVEWHTKVAREWETVNGGTMQFFTNDMPRATRAGIWDEHAIVQAFARHRLASVSSASAETRWGLDKDALALLKKAATFLDSAAGAGLELDELDAMELVSGLHELVAFDSSNCFHEDAALFLDGKILGTAPEDVITPEDAWQDLLEKDDRNSPAEYPEMCLIEYSELVDYMTRSFPSASPEPVPATNQAGEVDLRALIERAFMQFNRDDDDINAENLPSAYEKAAANAIIAALATQPATSQDNGDNNV